MRNPTSANDCSIVLFHQRDLLNNRNHGRDSPGVDPLAPRGSDAALRVVYGQGADLSISGHGASVFPKQNGHSVRHAGRSITRAPISSSTSLHGLLDCAGRLRLYQQCILRNTQARRGVLSLDAQPAAPPPGRALPRREV